MLLSSLLCFVRYVVYKYYIILKQVLAKNKLVQWEKARISSIIPEALLRYSERT